MIQRNSNFYIQNVIGISNWCDCWLFHFFSAEHVLSITSGIHLSRDCYNVQSKTEAYFKRSFTELFKVVPYSLPLAILAQVINTFCTFAWNYVDIHLMVISFMLTEKFKLMNNKLESQITVKSQKFWNELFTGFRIMAELIEKVNDVYGGIILLSFFSNLYFICVQLLLCLKWVLWRKQLNKSFSNKFNF